MKPEDDDAKAGMGAGSIGLGDLEANRESRDIFSRERVWRNRTTILQASAMASCYCDTWIDSVKKIMQAYSCS